MHAVYHALQTDDCYVMPSVFCNVVCVIHCYVLQDAGCSCSKPCNTHLCLDAAFACRAATHLTNLHLLPCRVLNPLPEACATPSKTALGEMITVVMVAATLMEKKSLPSLLGRASWWEPCPTPITPTTLNLGWRLLTQPHTPKKW